MVRDLQSFVAHPLKGGSDNLRDASRGERLQRVLADAGVGSRRACEEMIKEGHVSVNGRVITDLPCWVDPRVDRVLVKGRPLRASSEHVYIMLNKPARTLSAASDEPGADRRTVLDIVKHPSGARVYPVGRLDYDTTGLLLLTNDGDLTHRLTHPKFGGMRVYDAVVAGIVPPRSLEELNRRLGGARRAADAPAPVQIVGFDDGRTLLRLTILEGRGRSVQELLAKLGHHVKHLDRVAFGPLTLSGIARGEWRDLNRREIAQLKAGLSAPTESPKVRARKAVAKARTRARSAPRDDERSGAGAGRRGGGGNRMEGDRGSGRQDGRRSGGRKGVGGAGIGKAGGRGRAGSPEPRGGANRRRRERE